MMPQIEFSLGVHEYRCELIQPCVNNKNMDVVVHFSFLISGNFLPAAINDNLSETVDYRVLGENIKSIIIKHDCEAKETIINAAKAVISQFSPLITGGYLEITIRCHETFTTKERLI